MNKSPFKAIKEQWRCTPYFCVLISFSHVDAKLFAKLYSVLVLKFREASSRNLTSCNLGKYLFLAYISAFITEVLIPEVLALKV